MRCEARDEHEEASAESWTDQELLQRMRRDEALAIREFYRRFTPVLWKVARQAHVQPALRDDVVTDCLSDCRHSSHATDRRRSRRISRAISSRRFAIASRTIVARRSAATATGTAAAWAGDGERVVREVCSEASHSRERRPGRRSTTAVAGARAAVARHQRRHHRRGATDAALGQRVHPAAPRSPSGWGSRITRRACACCGCASGSSRSRCATRPRGVAGEREELYEFFRRSGLSERARRARRERARSGGPERSRRGAGRKSRRGGPVRYDDMTP